MGYRRIGSLPGESGSDEAWLSPVLVDQQWDNFLQGTPRGQFQQSSRWAEYKAHEGWLQHRIVLTGATGISGGFQILWKKSRLGRIGYITKGPVLASESIAAAESTIGILRATVSELNLRALIVQPPDESQLLSPILAHAGFSIERLKGVVRSTLLVNLTGGMTGVTSSMSSSARSEVKQAQRRGTVIREGGTQDIQCFFAMMTATCLRQGTKPNPATESELKSLWESLQPFGAKLMIANCRGEDVAGQLCVPFGDRVTIWKKGWSGKYRECHPNRLLNYMGLEWACGLGCKYWDYATLDEGIATSLLAGKTLTAQQKQSRHMFHLGFGGEPRLIPESQIWIGNPLLRLGYSIATKVISR